MGNPAIPQMPSSKTPGPPAGDPCYYTLRYVMGEISAPATKQLPKAGPDVQSPVHVTIDHPHGGRIKLTYVCWSYKHYRNRLYSWQLEAVERVE